MAKLSLRALRIFSAKRSDMMAFVKDVDTCSIVVMDKRHLPVQPVLVRDLAILLQEVITSNQTFLLLCV